MRCRGSSPGHGLDYAAREALRLKGRVPVLVASSLAHQSPGAFSLTLDFEMIRHSADKAAVEIDLGAIGDCKVILCVAKSSSTLATSGSDEKRDTAKLITACRALTADVSCLATVQAECDRAGGQRTLARRTGHPPSRPRRPRPASSV
jgi:hypothetical protein